MQKIAERVTDHQVMEQREDKETASRETSPVHENIRGFLAEVFFVDDVPNDASFLEQGIIDSTGMVELVMFLETAYGIKVEDSELVQDNLDSPNNIAAFIGARARYRGHRAASPASAPVPGPATRGGCGRCRTPDGDDGLRCSIAVLTRSEWCCSTVRRWDTRLSIVDLSGGHQPMRDPASGVCLVFNGEVFDHVELRQQLPITHSGLAAIPRSSSQRICAGVWPSNASSGSGPRVVGSPAPRTAPVARPAPRIRPLSYAESPEGVAFASEMKAIFAGGFLKPSFDPLALKETTCLWAPVPPRTAFPAF